MSNNTYYEEITNAVIEQLKKGIIPWEQPWVGCGGAYSHATGKPYSFINQLILQEPGEYYTFNQVKEAGGKIKKGAKSKRIFFWKFLAKDLEDGNGNKIKDKDGNVVQKGIPIPKYYRVFHESDVEGVEPREKVMPEGAYHIKTAEEIAEEYINREGIKYIEDEEGRAYYSPSKDMVHLPLRESFKGTAVYYSTKFHELVHSTGADARLQRGIESNAGFGSDSYSREELVAEIGAGALMNRLNIADKKAERNTTAYLQNWINALKNDEKALIVAAGKAEKAVNYIS